uniref:Annexin n=1 Tax=Leptobrachium leishanense TaxID=445787 RepID=A0A8C5LI21_9ANUR
MTTPIPLMTQHDNLHDALHQSRSDPSNACGSMQGNVDDRSWRLWSAVYTCQFLRTPSVSIVRPPPVLCHSPGRWWLSEQLAGCCWPGTGWPPSPVTGDLSSARHLRNEPFLKSCRMAYKSKSARGTIKDYPGFKANEDAEALRKAMKGLGTDEESIFKILTSRSNAQRQETGTSFKTLFGRDLVSDLTSELTGKFEKLIVALMTPACLNDAQELRRAIKGAGTCENVLIEILASRSTDELNHVKQVFQKEYGCELEDSITGDTSGYFQRMLVVLVQANRDPDSKVNDSLIEQDAQDLFKAGEMKWGTDEEKFITILGTRSNAHLRKVKCVRSVPGYFAETLNKAMKGAGTDDCTLIRVMVARSEIDLLDIRHEYRKHFGKSLHKAIQGDTSGDYRNTLLLICNGDDE